MVKRSVIRPVILQLMVALSVALAASPALAAEKGWAWDDPGEPLPKDAYLDHKPEDRWLEGVAFSPDGRLLATGGEDIRLWDSRTRKLLRSFGLHCNRTCGIDLLTFSPDGRFLFSTAEESKSDGEGEWQGFCLWEVATGKLIRSFKGSHNLLKSLAVAPDGKTVVSSSFAGEVRVWDAASGRELSRPYSRENDGRGSEDGVAVFSPDGKVLVTLTELRVIRLWDVASGREIKQITTKNKGMALGFPFTFSPDSRTLVATVGYRDIGICLWDVGSGRIRAEWSTCPLIEQLMDPRHQPPGRPTHYGISSLAYSPDGKLLACSGTLARPGRKGLRIGTLRLWEAATGQELGRWHIGEIGGPLAFSPDGRTVAVLTENGRRVALVDWTRPPSTAPRPKGKPSSDKCLALWAAVGGTNGRAAFRAMRELIAQPGSAVEVMREHLRPIPAVSPARLEHWIAQLNSEEFAVRERAASHLAGLAEGAEPALRKALDHSSAEVRRRAGELLRRLAAPPSPERVRYLRAVMVLEAISTAEARQLLEKLAMAGLPGARETEDARAACLRLERRAKRNTAGP